MTKMNPNDVNSKKSLSKYIGELENSLPKEMRESKIDPRDFIRAIRNALLDKSYSSTLSAFNSSDIRFLGKAIAAGTCYE
jgi:hypothetical protein